MIAIAPIASVSARFGAVPVEKLWPGETVVCLGSGPSLTQADVDYCRGRAKVIAIKHAIQFAPWADALYAAGADSSQWWPTYGPALQQPALRYTLDETAARWASVLKLTGENGLETDPSGLRTGSNSGYQAINLAVHFGAKKIVLLGFDMQPGAHGDHFFGNHARGNRLPFQLFLWRFPTIVEPLQRLGIELVNASRETALTCVARLPLQEALA